MKHSTGKIDIIVDWVYEPYFRCSLHFFTQQQIKYCSSISLSLYQNAYQPKQFFWLTIEKSELSLKILWLVSIHSKWPFKRSGGVKQYTVGALKVCRKVAFEAKFIWKAKKFVKICLRYFCTILYNEQIKTEKVLSTDQVYSLKANLWKTRVNTNVLKLMKRKSMCPTFYE